MPRRTLLIAWFLLYGITAPLAEYGLVHGSTLPFGWSRVWITGPTEVFPILLVDGRFALAPGGTAMVWMSRGEHHVIGFAGRRVVRRSLIIDRAEYYAGM